ncbi:hypothetical protein [Sphingopyxis kveilinensis]|uniref:hypothetical protein n=1 Tax=Sphingopyxis kveilinensis TaxID=3114367 RepID=UPI0030D41B46
MGDRYGHQGDLFDASVPAEAEPPTESELQWFHFPPKSPPIFQHTKESIRELMLATIAELRATDVMPWDAADYRYHIGNFRMCATWFQHDEIAETVRALEEELDRLGRAPAP